VPLGLALVSGVGVPVGGLVATVVEPGVGYEFDAALGTALGAVLSPEDGASLGETLGTT
jgi:hypothetical protein